MPSRKRSAARFAGAFFAAAAATAALCSQIWILGATGAASPSETANQDWKNISMQIATGSISTDPSKTETLRAPQAPPPGHAAPPDGRADSAASSQNFFQSFAPLFGAGGGGLGHSRPLLYPEHSFKPAYKQAAASYRELAHSGGASDNLLGSGNFGVVKGGTYYAEERDDGDFASDSQPYAYVGAASGGAHERPQHRRKNPPPAFRNGGDFFAHFRDFADITAPTKAFSHLAPATAAAGHDGVDAAASSAAVASWRRPNNINERLAMLDEEAAAARAEPQAAHDQSPKRSKFKRKLEAHRGGQRLKELSAKARMYSSAKEVPEPLLALS